MSNRSEKIWICIATIGSGCGSGKIIRIRPHHPTLVFREERDLEYFEAPDLDTKIEREFLLYLGEGETLVEGEDVGVVRDDVLRIAAGVAEGARHEDPVPHLQAGHAAPHLLHETRRICHIVRNKLNNTEMSFDGSLFQTISLLASVPDP
jgi:hypothetical protein